MRPGRAWEAGMQEAQQMLNWQSVISTLFSVFLGGVLVILSNYLSHHWQVSREKRSLAGAFAGEVAAILDIAKARGHIQYLKEVIAKLGNGARRGSFSFSITADYFNVFTSNAGKLGLLDAPFPKEIASFYARAFSIAEDIKAMHDPSCTFSKEELEGLLGLFESTQQLGQQIVNRIDGAK
jgi:hypothetical protein